MLAREPIAAGGERGERIDSRLVRSRDSGDACFRMECGYGCADDVRTRRIGNGPGDACSCLGKGQRRGKNGRDEGDTELSKHGNLQKTVWASLTAYPDCVNGYRRC